MFDYFDLGLFVYLDEAEAKEQEHSDNIRSTDSDTVEKEKEPHRKKIDD